MTKKLIKLLSFSLCFILIMPCLILTGYGEEVDDGIYYCRQALLSLPDGEKLVYAYDKIVEGISTSSEEIDIYNGDDNITVEELQIVYDAYRRDHTEHFWLGNSYNYSYNSSTVVSIKPSYVMSGEDLSDAKLKFENAAYNILSGITPSMTDYEKEKYLHDTLASRVKYIESPNAHNAYGALVEGEAVCEGYAEALQYLLQRAGIQSIIVLGSSVNPSTGTSEGHAWNMVKIDGSYYHLDLTWNDQGANTYYAYFNVTDTIIKKDHQIDDTAYALPECSSMNQNYFQNEGALLYSYTVDSIAQRLKDNSLIARVYIPDGGSDFITWCSSNISSIALKAGVASSFTWSYSSIGDEVILVIDTCNHDSLTSVQKKTPTCTENGNIAYYKCSCGKYFEDRYATVEILNKNSVTLLASHSFVERVEDDEHLRSTPSSCAEYYTYFYGCTGCNEKSTDKYYTSNKTLPHTLTKVDGVQATCSNEGRKAYYSCICGKHFSDANAKKEITDIENYGILPKSSHGQTDFLGRCTECGELAEITDTVIVIGLIIACIFIGLPIVITILKKKFKRKD
ncbi:MAG: hypothetical protein IJX51_07595 [Clostridia bacterium]|nr:hypothetical protein [Clostridia bacterium]